MASAFPEEFNPFEAPAEAAGPTPSEPAGTDAEVIRRRYLKHEASVRAVGTLTYLGAVVLGLIAIGLFIVVARGGAAPPPRQANFPLSPQSLFLIGGVVCVLLAMLNSALGYGLRRLQPWARWTSVVFITLNLVTVLGNFGYIMAVAPDRAAEFVGRNAISVPIMLYVIHLLTSAKGRIVFSPDYRSVIEQTPYIRYQTSPVVKVLLGLLLGFLVFIVIAAVIAGIRRM